MVSLAHGIDARKTMGAIALARIANGTPQAGAKAPDPAGAKRPGSSPRPRSPPSADAFPGGITRSGA
ncbi:hypothetical protein GCM10010519_11070 [Streptomyces lactacystinicus]